MRIGSSESVAGAVYYAFWQAVSAASRIATYSVFLFISVSRLSSLFGDHSTVMLPPEAEDQGMTSGFSNRMYSLPTVKV